MICFAVGPGTETRRLAVPVLIRDLGSPDEEGSATLVATFQEEGEEGVEVGRKEVRGRLSGSTGYNLEVPVSLPPSILWGTLTVTRA